MQIHLDLLPKMSTSWFVLLLSCGVVLQLAAAFPQLNDSGTAEPLLAIPLVKINEIADSNVSNNDELSHLSSAKHNLLLDTLDILADQSTDILRISNSLITPLVMELQTLPNKTQVTDEYIKRLEIAQKNVENIDFDDQPGEMENIFASVDELGEIFYDIESMHKKGGDNLLERAFERIGAENMDVKFNDTMQHALSELSKLFHDFEQSLTEKERDNEIQLIAWIKRFDDEDNLEDNLGNLLEEFFSFFE